MRLKSVELSGFRGFSKPMKIGLDADAVILVGANGRGKTCLLDSILWALSGKIPRLGDDSHIVSLYSESGQARVELELRDSNSRVIKIFRSSDAPTLHRRHAACLPEVWCQSVLVSNMRWVSSVYSSRAVSTNDRR